MLGGDPGSYEKAAGEGKVGEQTFPKIRSGFLHLSLAFDESS